MTNDETIFYDFTLRCNGKVEHQNLQQTGTNKVKKISWDTNN